MPIPEIDFEVVRYPADNTPKRTLNGKWTCITRPMVCMFGLFRSTTPKPFNQRQISFLRRNRTIASRKKQKIVEHIRKQKCTRLASKEIHEELTSMIDVTEDSISIQDLPQISNPTICGRSLPFHIHVVGCQTRFEKPCLIQVYIIPIVAEIEKLFVKEEDDAVEDVDDVDIEFSRWDFDDEWEWCPKLVS